MTFANAQVPRGPPKPDTAVTIFGYSNWHCTREWLYVAGTRTRRLSDVHYFRGSVQPHGRTETELRGWLSRMIASCLASDTRAGRAFNAETAITTDEVLRLLRTSEKGKTRWHLTCAACSREMQLLCGGYDADKLSIDRLNNLLAHVKGNIQLLCLRCNKAKH